MSNVENKIVGIGIFCLLVLLKILGVLFCCVKLNSMWLLVYILLLYIESVVVKIIKLSKCVV